MGCLRVVHGVTKWDKMRNIQLRSLGGLDRVEVMVMRRRLCWLGHLERMEDSRIPKCLLACRPANGKRSVGGQKRRWNDLVRSDLQKCNMLADWREVAQKRAAWRGVVKTMTAKLNGQLEASEKERKDERKVRREEGIQPPSIELRCEEPGCMFVGQTKAGLVNHTRQRHGSKAQLQHKCTFCDKSFHKQGIPMHMRHCQMNPDGC